MLLTGRDAERVAAVAGELDAASAGARVEGRVLDVRDTDAIAALAAELGAVDLFFSNATARMTPDDDPVDMVDAVVDTNNRATVEVLRAFAPVIRPGGRSGDRRQRPRHPRQTARRGSAALRRRRGLRSRRRGDADPTVARGSPLRTRRSRGLPRWLNIPSKVLQVAATRALAAERREVDLAAGRLILALCPGLIDTAASRPWFEDMSSAQTPEQAADSVLRTVLAEPADPALYGELVQFGTVLPWTTGMPVPHRALTS